MNNLFSLIIRYWSLKSATSNIKKNFIVTGVRFVKKSRVIHVEVEQAKALPEGRYIVFRQNDFYHKCIIPMKLLYLLTIDFQLPYLPGEIDEASRVWLESQPIKIDDDYGKESSAEIDIPPSNTNQKEYFVMNYEKRSLDIDQLQAPASHVITGVRFRNLGGHLNLEARVSHFIDGTLKYRSFEE